MGETKVLIPVDAITRITADAVPINHMRQHVARAPPHWIVRSRCIAFPGSPEPACPRIETLKSTSYVVPEPTRSACWLTKEMVAAGSSTSTTSSVYTSSRR